MSFKFIQLLKPGHESNGFLVEHRKYKEPVVLNTPNVRDWQNWHTGCLNKKALADEYRAIGNPAYYIPEFYWIKSKSSLSEMARGSKITKEFFHGLHTADQENILTAFANLLNDMHQSRPIEYGPEFSGGGKSWDDLNFEDALHAVRHLLTREEMDLTTRVRANYEKYIAAHKLPMVFSHNDLSPENSFYSVDTAVTSIIDFGEAGYRPLIRSFELKQCFKFEDKDIIKIMEIYKTLPKKQHISWDIEPAIYDCRFQLRNVLAMASMIAEEPTKYLEARTKILQENIAGLRKYRYIFGKNKLRTKDHKDAVIFNTMLSVFRE